MTVKQYNEIIEKAQTNPSYRQMEEQPFSCGTSVLVEWFDCGNDYRIKKIDGKVEGILDMNGHIFIRPENLTSVNFGDYSNKELEDLIKQIQTEMRERKQKESEEAIRQFREAWQELQKFGNDVRIRVTLNGEEKTHKHVYIKDLDLRILPVR